MLPMSLDYVHVVLNARGGNASILYSIRDVPLMLIPLIAWATGRFSSVRVVGAAPSRAG